MKVSVEGGLRGLRCVGPVVLVAGFVGCTSDTSGGGDMPVACAVGTWDDDANDATACVPWTPCSAGQYVAVDGTQQTDRTCAACDNGTFSLETNATDCTAWSVCADGEYEAAAGTATANRVCLACADGTWDNSADAPSACVAWGTCDAGSYVATAGTATADRTCEPCEEGSYAADTNQDSCSAWTDCAAGQYVLAEGSATTDRMCANCASGTFSTAVNAESCKPWTDCAAGQKVLVDGSTSADRTCEACGDGTYSTALNSAVCADVGTCAAGTHQTAAGTSTSPVACQDCDAGTYCAGGSAAPVTCASGTWDNDDNPASECVPWTDCAAGTRVSVAGSTTTDRTCAMCASQKYSNTTNASSCTSWTTCAAGKYVLATGSATANRTCAACDAGEYSTTTNAAECTPWTECLGTEYEKTAGTDTADRVCATSCSESSPTSQARVLVTDTTDLYPTTFTYEMRVWFHSFSSTDPGQYFLQAVASGYQLLYLRAFQGNLECVIGTGSGELRAQYALSNLSTDTWYHVACTRNGTELALWVNGTKVGTNTSTPYAPPPPGTPLSLGGDSRTPPDSPQFVGGVDEVRISNVVRYSASFTPTLRATTDANALAVFHFDECSGTSTADAAKPSRTGSLDYAASWGGG